MSSNEITEMYCQINDLIRNEEKKEIRYQDWQDIIKQQSPRNTQ